MDGFWRRRQDSQSTMSSWAVDASRSDGYPGSLRYLPGAAGCCTRHAGWLRAPQVIEAAPYEEKPRAARRPSSIRPIACGVSAPRSRVTSSGYSWNEHMRASCAVCFRALLGLGPRAGTREVPPVASTGTAQVSLARFCCSLSGSSARVSGGTVAALEGPRWEGFMGRTARERLAKLLDDAQASGAFSAQILAPADALRVEVDGVGAVHPPVRAPLAKKLIAVARPAMFGRGEQTLSDTGVRDTWEIMSDLVTLSGPAWEATLGAVLDDVRDELGLPPTTKLRVELRAMLVYGKGQFFLPHQDSEKDDAMVGTLVVSLPSAHTGGELVVAHGGQSVTYRVPREELSFVAFYADCRHEVKPVKSGYRVTLTLNLLADSEADAQGAGPVADLAHCLTGHLTTPATRRYGRAGLDPPNRLVFLLDHEYTQRGLSWNRLKGADAERAALLRAAAERAGCEAVLALSEVKETWDAWPSDGEPRDDYDYYEEEEEEEEEDDVSRDRGGDHDDYQLNELIDDETPLGWWTSRDGTGGEPISLHVPDSAA